MLTFGLWRIAFCLAVSILALRPVYAENAEYLKYQEPQAQVSLLANIDVILYMITMFLLILGLAYFTSRFVGRRMSLQPGAGSDKVLSILQLGPNRALYLVEFADRLFILSVTDHQVQLLQDLTDSAVAAGLKSRYGGQPDKVQFENVFQKHLASLHEISQKFPRVFDDTADQEQLREKSEKKEKR